MVSAFIIVAVIVMVIFIVVVAVIIVIAVMIPVIMMMPVAVMVIPIVQTFVIMVSIAVMTIIAIVVIVTLVITIIVMISVITIPVPVAMILVIHVTPHASDFSPDRCFSDQMKNLPGQDTAKPPPRQNKAIPHYERQEERLSYWTEKKRAAERPGSGCKQSITTQVGAARLAYLKPAQTG